MEKSIPRVHKDDFLGFSAVSDDKETTQPCELYPSAQNRDQSKASAFRSRPTDGRQLRPHCNFLAMD
jgi:hypothetical protein